MDNAISLIEKNATSVECFNVVIGALLYGYTDTSDFSTVEYGQTKHGELQDGENVIVILDFDLLIDSIDLAELIGALTVAKILYEEFRDEFKSVLLQVHQIKKLLYAKSNVLRSFLLEWVFAFKIRVSS